MQYVQKPMLIAIICATVLTGALLLEASDSSTIAAGANQQITAHSTCSRVTNNSATGLSVYVPTVTSAEWASFRASPPSGINITGCVTPGSQTYSTPGTYTFTIPDYNTITIQVWSGGGGGVGADGVNFAYSYAGSPGGTSRWNGSQLFATGGQGGVNTTGVAAVGGTGSGGTSNMIGGNGAAHVHNGGCVANGGAGASGGAGGSSATIGNNGNPGLVPGGGGGSLCFGGGRYGTRGSFPSGAGGGYAARTYAFGTFTPGSVVTVIVGAGGAGGQGVYDGGAGAPGQVIVTWN